MPSYEELDFMAARVWPDSKGWGSLSDDGRFHIMQLAIAAKHAKAVCDLAEDSAKYMARIVM